MTFLLDDTATKPTRCPGVALCADGAPAVGHRTWNQVARLGSFKGHPQGEFEFTPQVFADIIRNFRATENREVPVDYEHTSETLPPGTALHGVPAPAWVVDLEDRGAEGLWGLYDWKDPAAVDHIRAGRIKYVSPAVNFNATDKVTGEPIGARLTSVALTNHPFLDGMAPLVASENAPAQITPDAVAATLRAAPVEYLRNLETLLSDVQRTDVTIRLGLTPGAVHIPTGVKVTPSNTRSNMDKFHKAFRAKFKLADDADEGAMMSALEKHLGEHEKLASEYAKLSEKAEKLASEEKKREMAEAAECSERAIKDYGLPATDATRKRLIVACLTDRAGFDELYPRKAAQPSAVVTMSDEVDALLRSRVTPQGSASSTPVQPGAVAAKGLADRSDALATKLMSERQGLSYAEAIEIAEARCMAEAAAEICNRLGTDLNGVR
jgi:phage I-like protein